MDFPDFTDSYRSAERFASSFSAVFQMTPFLQQDDLFSGKQRATQPIYAATLDLEVTHEKAWLHDDDTIDAVSPIPGAMTEPEPFGVESASTVTWRRSGTKRKATQSLTQDTRPLKKRRTDDFDFKNMPRDKSTLMDPGAWHNWIFHGSNKHSAGVHGTNLGSSEAQVRPQVHDCIDLDDLNERMWNDLNEMESWFTD